MTDPRTGSTWILGDKFTTVHPHHESISSLWNKKWKFPCERSVYPFHDGIFQDFEPIFNSLISKNIHDGYTDEYSQEFVATADNLAQQGDKAAKQGNKDEAVKLYLRSCAVSRIGRFPYINSPFKREIFEHQKKTYMKAAALFDPPLQDIAIPNAAGTSADEGKTVPLYVRTPHNASPSDPCPSVILICGLDGHRPDNTVRSDEFTARGWASIIVDCPGTADSPADRKDPTSAERQMTSILDWMSAQGVYDMKKVLVWGVSAGGYNAVRAAHTHAERIAGAVGHGAGTHHFFSRAWLEKANWHEYPWSVIPAMREKLGYETDEEYLENAQKTWSLVETGVVNMPSCRLLLVNGTHDGLMPIEDSVLLMEYGSPKEARFMSGLLHMGYPAANSVVYPWLESVVGVWKPGQVNGHQ